MTELPDLKALNHKAKDALIEELWSEVQALREATKPKPKKTSQNSSLPPAKGFKPNQGKKSQKQGNQDASETPHHEGGRSLSETPDQIIKAEVKSCADCGALIAPTLQQLLQRYDKIDIPPIRPVVTRVERYGCRCPECGMAQIAVVPAELEQGSPFSPRIGALVTTLRYGHAISYKRLQQLLSEVFGLGISQGGISNLLSQVKQQLQAPVAEILKRLQQSDWVGSDETSARVNGQNQWEWLTLPALKRRGFLHQIRPKPDPNGRCQDASSKSA
jgi:transposase